MAFHGSRTERLVLDAKAKESECVCVMRHLAVVRIQYSAERFNAAIENVPRPRLATNGRLPCRHRMR